jgi:hypothetical protein
VRRPILAGIATVAAAALAVGCGGTSSAGGGAAGGGSLTLAAADALELAPGARVHVRPRRETLFDG